MLTMFKRTAAAVFTPAANKVTLFVSDLGIPSYKDDAGLVTPMSGQPIPAGYIDGFKMEYVSGTQIRFTGGSAYVPSLGRAITLASPVTKTPTLAASTWYHNYAYDNAGTPDVEVSTTAPAAPYNGTARTKTGDTSRRYIGSFKTDASAAIIKFMHNGSQVSYAGNVSSNLVLNASVTAATNIDVTTYFPVTSATVQVLILNGAAVNLNIGYANGPVPGSGSWVTFLPGGSSQKLEAPYPAAGDNLQAKYDTSSASGSLGWAAGYTYGR